MKQPNDDLVLAKTPVICKPFEEAFQKVFEMAKINPQRTVRLFVLSPGNYLLYEKCMAIACDLPLISVNTTIN